MFVKVVRVQCSWYQCGNDILPPLVTNKYICVVSILSRRYKKEKKKQNKTKKTKKTNTQSLFLLFILVTWVYMFGTQQFHPNFIFVQPCNFVNYKKGPY